jgi:RecA/RadA recombinase
MADHFFKGLVKDLNDENTNLADSGANSSEYSGCIDSGSYILNAALTGSLYGGVPNNKITAWAGESATGKTFFVLGIVRHFLHSNPNAGVFYFDTEAAVTKSMMEDRGIDTSRVVISEPETIQQFRHTALKVLDKYIEDPQQPMMFVLDSLGQLSTTKEMEDSSEGKETRDMTKAQVIKACFRVLSLKCAKANVPLLVTNHVYEVVGSYFPTKEMSGGSGLKYAASTICYLSKKKDKDGTDIVGNILKVKMVKSRFSKENKQVEVRLSYDKGLDKYYGLLDLAEKYNVFKKVSTRFELPDGSKVFGKQINGNPEKYYTPDVMEKLEEAARQEFEYGNYPDTEGSDESYEADIQEDG